MTKTNFADEADKLLNGTASKTKKKKTNKTEAIKKWLLKEVWNGRPINWLAVGISYVAIAYTAYALAKFYVRIPEIIGIVAFVSTLVIGSRAFKK